MQTVPRTAPDIHSPTHTPSPLRPPLLAPPRPPFPAALTEKPAADTGRRLSEVADWAGWTEPRLPEVLVNTPLLPLCPSKFCRTSGRETAVCGGDGDCLLGTRPRVPRLHERVAADITSSHRHWPPGLQFGGNVTPSFLPSSLLPTSYPCVGLGGHQYPKGQRGHPNAHEGKIVSPDPFPAAPQRVPLSQTWFLLLGVWGVGWPLGLSSTTLGLEICGFGSSSSLCPGFCVHLSSVSTWSSPPPCPPSSPPRVHCPPEDKDLCSL